MDLAFRQHLEDDIDRHQLGHRRRVHLLVGILGEDHRAGVVILEDHLTAGGLDLAELGQRRNRHRNENQSRDESRSGRSEEHTSELQSLMRISYAVFCLKKKKQTQTKETVSQ